ncbi:hypothetical protein RSO41_01405 [Halomonas sp. I1]|uniref:hypothetical protein n=1 Tax=Halomonas sp. I1 TaxID=393536 RepID=UPI0028E02829|nr:hypothetical protein [Halomonas sp. I1]MDT8893297.1 hypothetical protein [Halomonas sp. I1]
MARILLVFLGCVMGFLVISLPLEVARVKWGVPITILDLIFSPSSAAACFFVVKGIYKKRCSLPVDMEGGVKKKVISFLVFSALVIPFGVWVVWGAWSGNIEAFDYYSSVHRGAVHGYTLILMGPVLLMIWVLMGFQMVSNMLTNKRSDN